MKLSWSVCVHVFDFLSTCMCMYVHACMHVGEALHWPGQVQAYGERWLGSLLLWRWANFIVPVLWLGLLPMWRRKQSTCKQWVILNCAVYCWFLTNKGNWQYIMDGPNWSTILHSLLLSSLLYYRSIWVILYLRKSTRPFYWWNFIIYAIHTIFA